MPVTTKHPDYTRAAPLWRLVRDCLSGPDAVRRAGVLYLPIPDADNETADGSRYQAYLKRANYVNYTGRTAGGLIGAAMRKSAEVLLPAQIEYMGNDADGQGNSVEQIARAVLANVIPLGRHGILTDYPENPGGLTLEEERRNGLRPALRLYAAETVINWRTTKGQLSLVVLQEEAENYDADQFDATTEKVYRVLELVDGVYTQTVYSESGAVQHGPIVVRKADGTTFDEIPFVVPGSINNTPDVDPVTFEDLASVNIAHYRNSADYEEGLFIHSQPTLHLDIGTMRPDEWNALNPNGVRVGSRSGLVTSGGGSAQLLQAEATGAGLEAMRAKEAQLVQIGARVVEAGGTQRTAYEVGVNAAAEHSLLDTAVLNTEEALVRALRWAAEFGGGNPDDVALELNKDFFDSPPDAQVIQQLMGLEVGGYIPKTQVNRYLRSVDLLDPKLTDEDLADQVGDQGVG